MPEVASLSGQGAPMEEIPMDTTVLIIGGGWIGIKVAQELIDMGYGVVLAESGTAMGGEPSGHPWASVKKKDLTALLDSVKEADGIEILTAATLVSLTGVPGRFQARFEQGGESFERAVGAVVVALETQRVSLAEAYGLRGDENILTQSQLEHVCASGNGEAPLFGGGSKDVLFLVGLQQEGNPVVMERAIQSALQVQDNEGLQATILVGNVKLAQHGLETLYKESREKGVLYFKLRETPHIKQNGADVSISFFDNVIHDQVVLRPDVLVVEEAIRPHPQASEVAQALGIVRDGEGFLQPDNVHFLSTRSNREGIYVVGPARLPSSLAQGWKDAQNAVLEIWQLLGKGKRVVPKEKATIHRGKCTICLTCFRVCPHGAIYWDNRAVISPTACQGCGICASECPMDAIQLVDFRDDQIEDQILQGTATSVDGPQMIAFCCQNSAYEAAQMARMTGDPLPKGLKIIQVPCAGKVDVDYILTAFKAGVDGVLVLACHKDNCKSQQGNTFAQWRVEHARRMLEESGLEQERLLFATMASNMPIEFVRITKGMEDKLNQLGHNPIRKGAAA
ncbi:MAG: hydrogenase iron-sulfur subunit [Thermodesulfobacteriota bacterium]|nr:hydrogenase iron-sulfur subunit [Thermodesulfobacteriota bacterium]